MKKIRQILEEIFVKKKKEAVLQDAGKFVAAFFVSGAFFYAFLSLTGNFFHKLAAESSALLAKNFFETRIVFSEFFPHLQGTVGGSFFDAEINDLCSGRLELAVMAGLVFASRDKKFLERIKGIFLGAILLLVFNPFRIFLTLSSVGTPFLFLVHDVLFRLSLIIVLVTFYALWYYWR